MTAPSFAPTTLPLTAAQLTLWFDETYMDDCGLHTMGDCLDVRGPIDIDRFVHTLQLTMNETDAVRAHYRLADNRPIQEFAEQIEIPVAFFEFDEESTADDRVALAWDDMNRRMDLRMDISRPPLVYVVLYPIAPAHLLVLTAMHHIVADGYSRTAIYARWRELYDGGTEAGTPLLPLSTLLEAESSYLAGPGLAADERYWRQEVAALPERVSLSIGGSEPGCRRLRETVTLEREQTQRLRGLVEKTGLTWTAALIATSLLYTAKFAGRDHVQVTFPVTARTTRAVRRTPGMLANYPPLAARIEQGDTFGSLIHSVGRAILRTLKHQRYRVQTIRNLAGFHQSDHVAFGPYVNVIPQEPALRFGEATAILRNVSTGAVDDLMFTFMEAADGGLDIHVDGNPALQSAAQVRAHATRLSGLLRRSLSDLSVVIADLPLLVDGDPAITADAGPQGPLDVPGVVESIHRVAAQDPTRTAVEDDDGVVSYLELTVRADAIARRLRPGTVAAIVAEPGRDFVAAVVAALQAGAAWTPIDTDSPYERQLTLIADSGASIILTTAEFSTRAGELAAASGIDTVTQIDALVANVPADVDVGALTVSPAAPDSVAYIMFTSGTTGRPKGVMVHRAGLLNHLLAKVELLELGVGDALMQNAPVTFDVSIWQMLAPLLCGGVTRPVTRSTAGNPTAIAEIIASAGLTHLELVPSFLRVALEYFDAIEARPFASLKALMVTGEALPVDLCTAVHDRYPALPVINAYGPTECSDDVAHALLPAGRTLGLRAPIGVPIRNTRLLVLGPDLLPVPDGVVGELYVAGPCVGPGYLGDPVKTAWAFTALPGLAPGQRAYRTGDHVLRNALGELEFVERRDHQIKINGQRIELGEVEAGLRQLTGVADAAASVVQTAGTARLVGHLVLKDLTSAELDKVVTGLRAELAGRVSAHLVPALWSLMDVLPLTAHGKVDRKALPDGAQVRPATASGHTIVHVGAVATDGSAGATARRTPLPQRRTGPPAPVMSGPDAGGEAAVSVPLPPTPIQLQLADDAGPLVDAVRSYSQFVRLAVPPGLTSADVDSIMTRLTEVHPMLAVRLDRASGGGWHLAQRCFGVNGWTSPSHGDPEADLAGAVAALDVESGILWRAVLDATGRTLLLAIHHLVVDGVSWRILQSDLEQLIAGNQPQPEGTEFRDWAADQLVAAHHPLIADQQRRLWTAPQWQPTVRIPAGAESAIWADSRVHLASLQGDPISRLLATTQSPYGAHINDLLLAALGLALAALPGLTGDDPVGARVDVEVEGPGREDISAMLATGRPHDLGRTVGWFTTNYPVSVRVCARAGRGADQVRSLVADVHEQTSAMVAHGLTHGLARWLDAGLAATVARRPVPSVGFNYLGRFRKVLPGGDQFAFLPATAGGEAIGTAVAGALPLRHRLEVTPVVWDTAHGPQLVTSWRYDSTAVTTDQVERLAGAWHDALAAVVEVGEARPALVADPPVVRSWEGNGGNDADTRERWRAHLFGLRGGPKLDAVTIAPARPERLTIPLDPRIEAALAGALAAGRTGLRALVHVAWAGALAEHSGHGEAVFGAEFSADRPSGAPCSLLPLRVRLRPGEDQPGLVSRIDEEFRVLQGAAGLTLAQVLRTVPGTIPERIADTAVLVREAPVPHATLPVRSDPTVESKHLGAVLTLIATARTEHSCDFELEFDAAKMTHEEIGGHGTRFVASLAALLGGRLPVGFRAASGAGGRILPRRAETAGQETGPGVESAYSIAAAMTRVLGCAQVGPDDVFFALGGDSISVISLVSELRAAGHDVQVRDVYRHRTPRELAAACMAAAASAAAAAQEVTATAAPAAPARAPENLLQLGAAELAALEAELGF